MDSKIGKVTAIKSKGLTAREIKTLLETHDDVVLKHEGRGVHCMVMAMPARHKNEDGSWVECFAYCELETTHLNTRPIDMFHNFTLYSARRKEV